MPQHILFDLDGTLTDPGDGITASVAYALQGMGLPPAPRAQLERFIGPPLDEAFSEFCGLDAEQSARAIELFREYFSRQGIFENTMYPGVPDMLRRLEDAGKKLYIATSKPTVFALQILQHFGISLFFADVQGSPLTHSGLPKAQVIEAVLAGGVPRGDAIMVGDRKHDILGAAETGLASVGVSFGYGGAPELAAAGADYIVDTVDELADLLLSKI